MNDIPVDTRTVTATLVSDSQRLDFLPRHFRNWALTFEGAVYTHLRDLCADYNGGYWRFFDLSNGSGFMAPDSGQFRLTAPNDYEGTVDADTAGIIATLYALSHLSFQHPHAEVFGEHFHALREFALDHPNAEAIFAAID
jgi:hypothetical protein